MNFSKNISFAALGILSGNHKFLGFVSIYLVPDIHSTAKQEANSLLSIEVWYRWDICILLSDVLVDKRVCMNACV